MADVYAEQHLVEVTDPAIAQAATVTSAQWGRTVRIRRCTRLGLLWLHAPLTTDGASLLLRGAVPQTGQTTTEPTGFYL